MKTARIEKLTPIQELKYLRDIYGVDQNDKLYTHLADSFKVLQTRSQLLLSLVTICLTITGFSGPKIASSGLVSRYAIVFGLGFVLFSALVLLLGPLQLRWCTQNRAGTIDESLAMLIGQRNSRTTKYHIASTCLIIGLTGYVISVIYFLLTP